MLRLVPQPLCSKTPRLHLAAVSSRKMAKQSASPSITKYQNQLTFPPRSQVKLPHYHLSNSRLEITFTPVCWESLLSHITQTHSEADFHNQQLWCHTKIHLKSLSETDLPTTRDNLFQPIWTISSSHKLSRLETPVSSPIKLLDQSTCKTFELSWYNANSLTLK